ncbi:MAG TPA: aminotransferase class V-fold PLP-dependent enzyme, partial [Planctomycetota bacterium]|nr:aminotransferase class V-fold PLP-dependent enzyme [Planctomycetota bacterium]
MDDGLELSPELLSAWTRAIDERLGTFLRELSSSPAASHDPPSRGAQEELRKAAPEQGSSLETILDFLFREIIPPSLNTAGPGYLAYVPGGGLPSAALAEYIAAIVNRYTGVWAAAPAAVELETQAIRWLAELLGMAPGSLGVMTTGGSISNLIAVIAAREKLLGRSIERGTIYVSQEVHHSLLKAARTAGIPPENVRSIPVDDTFRMAIDPLVEQIRADRTAGFLPFFVCASAGTVNTGAMDPIDAIADVAEEEGIWLHVDGAYGGFFRLVPELA